MSDPGVHRQFMQRALALAERGRGLTSPNPIVGAVLVASNGTVVGQGAHMVAGGPHAEVAAIEAAGPSAAGTTLYCTLEPCSHQGRTGPCVARILSAGIARVVIAVRDPNPRVAGRGVTWLRASGVDVVEGVEATAATTQHGPFFTWITRGRPFVTAKIVTSVDGFVGPEGAPVRLTSSEADRFFHRQRAEVDAVAVGAGTVLTDDPQLTPRGAFRTRPLTRVIVDWRGRVPETARLFSTLGVGPVIMVTSPEGRANQSDRFARLTDRGVEVVVAAAHDLSGALAQLGSRSIVSLLVEGGPRLHHALASAGLVDRVQWVVTPHRLTSGVTASSRLVTLEKAAHHVTALGPDWLIEFNVHRTD